jgi:hypothetical protein
LSFCQTIGACQTRLDAHYGFFATPEIRALAAKSEVDSEQFAAFLNTIVKAYKA